MKSIVKQTIKKRINLWTQPRSSSTSLMYSFKSRGDCSVVDEPLYAHYVNETNVYRPYKDALFNTQSTSFKHVKQQRQYSTSDDLLISMAKGASITGCTTNDEMVDKIIKAGLLTNKRAINAMLQIDRKYFVPTTSTSNNNDNNINKKKKGRSDDGNHNDDRKSYDYYYENKPIKLGSEATISTPQFCAEVLELMAPKLIPGAKVLDIGCGSGYLSSIFAVLVEKKGCVVGIDCFNQLIEDAKVNIFDVVQKGVASGSTGISNIGTIELYNETFPGTKSKEKDGSTSYEFFNSKQIIDNHHDDILYDCIYIAPCVDDEKLLMKLNNLLKPNGRLVVPYYDVKNPSNGQQLLCLDKVDDSNGIKEEEDVTLWKSKKEIMPVLCQIMQVEETIATIMEQEKQKDMDKQKKQINKEDAKQEMLEWVAKFELENNRKPNRDDIANDSEGKALFETFQNAPPS